MSKSGLLYESLLSEVEAQFSFISYVPFEVWPLSA